jgi:D-3-phosphoglycerate dehydrogenase
MARIFLTHVPDMPRNYYGECAVAALRELGEVRINNMSRGNLVDEVALARALDEKRIAGAAMDVGRAADQMPSLALAARPDVLATPHAVNPDAASPLARLRKA